VDTVSGLSFLFWQTVEKGNIPKVPLQSSLLHVLLGFAFRYANHFSRNL